MTPGIVITLTAVFLLAAASVLLVVRRNRRRPPPEFVIGREMAEAAKVEEQRLASVDPNEPPLLDGKYDFWRGDMNLIDPQPSELDVKIRTLCHRFMGSNADEQKNIRSSLSMDDFYTLMTFSNRSSVFALRKKNVNYVMDGLIAVAIIERERVDYRDIPLTLSLLYHAADRIGEDADELFRKVACLTSEGVSREKIDSSTGSMREKFRIQLWGYDEVETRHGAGFCHHDYADYQPSYDLVSAALDIADLFTADKYQLDSISTGAEIPPVWLKPANDPALGETLEAVRAAVSIRAKLRPNVDASYDSQMLLTFLAEVTDETAAKKLQKICGKVEYADHSLVGSAAGRLFCVIIQSSWVIRVRTYESAESLSRFSEGITQVLERYATGSQ